MMKTGVLIVVIVGLALTLSFKQNNDSYSVTVVELFTSQGCSSCPSADKLLSELSKKENVLALSFHVSYWNYLGWKDPYSNEQYTERQRDYARVLHLRSIYTPQMIVNGKNEFVGSDRVKAQETIKETISSQKVALKVEQRDTEVQIDYSLEGPTENRWVHVALVERHVRNEVPKGENSGRILEHDNVVRIFKSLEAKASGSLKVELPEGLNPGNAAIIVYIQNKKTFEITGGSKNIL